MPFVVLTDNEVGSILENLTFAQVESFREVLQSALREYSIDSETGTVAQSDAHQPRLTKITSPVTGATTLFLPSLWSSGHGVKVVTQPPPLLDQPGGRKPFNSSPTSSITLFSPDGHPIGILHARTLTAFRTALASSYLVARRARVHNITVFGSGLQAYWHIRLALLQHGPTIRNIYIINHRFSESSKLIFEKFHAIAADTKQQEGWQSTCFNIITPSCQDFQRLLAEQVQDADVIFCCTPSNKPLFDAHVLASCEARAKARLIIAIGSCTPQMRELPTELLIQAIRPQEPLEWGYIGHKKAYEGGAVIVDTVQGALKCAGEIIEAKLTPMQLVELGELVLLEDLARQSDVASPSNKSYRISHQPDHNHGAGTEQGTATARRKASASNQRIGNVSFRHRSPGTRSSDDNDQWADSMTRWLKEGNVIYKSVGLGLMDLVVGMCIVKLARERCIGCYVDEM